MKNKFLSIFLAALTILSVLCTGTVGVFAAQNNAVIKIKIDGDTFEDTSKMYCSIYDDTCDDEIASWVLGNNEMTNSVESNVWIYDLNEHKIELNPAHSYSVTFFSDKQAQTLPLLITGYDAEKEYTAVFSETYISESFYSTPTYVYKWIGDNEDNTGSDIIRINADKNSFSKDFERIYCEVFDQTSVSYALFFGRMTKENESDIHSFDFGKHGIQLTPGHTYTVTFTDGRAETTKLTIDYYDRSKDYTAVFTGKFVTDEIGINRSEYKWTYEKEEKNDPPVIKKKAQKMTVSKVTKTVKARKLKNAKQTVKGAIKVKNSKGALSYSKVSGSKYLSISRNGVITVKKGKYAVNRTLSIKVKVSAAGTKTYKKASKTVTVKIKTK